ncbi:hypothetical protein EP7_002119 [Isosphaeraceae bacterium EP7]
MKRALASALALGLMTFAGCGETAKEEVSSTVTTPGGSTTATTTTEVEKTGDHKTDAAPAATAPVVEVAPPAATAPAVEPPK